MRFGNDFGTILGPFGEPLGVPFSILEGPGDVMELTFLRLLARKGPRERQRRILEDFGSILGAFWLHFGRFWGRVLTFWGDLLNDTLILSGPFATPHVVTMVSKKMSLPLVCSSMRHMVEVVGSAKQYLDIARREAHGM